MQMICAWQEFIEILPPWIRKVLTEKEQPLLEELRLRVGKLPQLHTAKGDVWLHREATADDLKFIINTASQYSPWTAASISKGYITARGGHRIGICGESVLMNGIMTGIKNPTSLCMRVARDFDGIASPMDGNTDSLLIIGSPGSGKTTLLRDLIRRRSDLGIGCVAVVDERGEIFPTIQGRSCFNTGRSTDIMTGCTKQEGIDTVLRTMGPACIAVDEITNQADCDALLKAGWSGVSLLATAHAGSMKDLRKRPVYRPIIEAGLFDAVLVLQKDKSWRAERLSVWN